jgi:hypothetical protein
MADSARAAVSNWLRPRSILVWFALTAFLFWFYDQSVVQLGMAIATSTILGLSQVFTEVRDLRSEVRTLGLALVTLLGAVSLFVFGGSTGDSGAAVAFVLIGGWLALDAGQTLRHEGWRDTDDHDGRDGHDVYREYVVRQVDSELRERALTRRELGVELGADDRAIDHALDVLAERGLLSRTGSELRVSSPPEPGTFARVRSGIVAPLARLARPLTIELDDGNAEDEGAHSRPAAKPVGEGGRERERESA